MAELTKAGLDAATDRATMVFRHGVAPTLTALQREYADSIARDLSVQFPGVPHLDRIVIACALELCTAVAGGARADWAVAVLAGAGVALEGAADA